ncbi:phage baseplate protein, partial [Glaesserella parasuis]|nr:phage baseplate protein [Glaesserella parasuis]MDE3963094.1 phage baseplate protein [Glaesserella parasuis]
VKWCVAEDIERQIYATEFDYGNK